MDGRHNPRERINRVVRPTLKVVTNSSAVAFCVPFLLSLSPFNSSRKKPRSSREMPRLQFGGVKKLFLSDGQSHSGRALLLFVFRFHHYPLQHDPDLTLERGERERERPARQRGAGDAPARDDRGIERVS